MKNITVSLDDESYRRARIKAAEAGTSVSALVRQFLTDLGAGESDFKRKQREERELREKITQFAAGDRLTRDALHARDKR
jgi:plasmid stability protein